MKQKEKKEEKQEVAVVVQPKRELVLEGDPEQQLQFAMKAANALMKAVNQKPKKVMIRGEQYLEYGDWQTLARFFGATASVAWSKKLIDDKGGFLGYEARAEVLHNGQVISSAEAMCMKVEKNWSSRDEFMLRSMAQTRASAKALRNAYGWVAELAGMKSTPAEEMGDQYDQTPVKADVVPVVYYDDPEEETPVVKTLAIKIKPPKVVADLTKKDEIKKLIDTKVLDPLEQTKEAYEEYVKGNTGLELVPPNYDTIIERLRAL